MKVYSVNPNINNSLVTEIQNSTSPNHRTEYRLTMARRTRPTPMRMAGCSESVQYSTMTFMAVSSKQMRASWVMMYWRERGCQLAPGVYRYPSRR
jgi:hypothetical protein